VDGTRTPFWFVGAVILGFTMGCGSVNDPSAVPGLKNSAAGWRIQYSPSMPPDPTLGGAGTWYLDFPIDVNYPDCVQPGNCKSLNYVTTAHGGPATHNVTMTFQILTTGAPTFNYILSLDNTCATQLPSACFWSGRTMTFRKNFIVGGLIQLVTSYKQHPETLL